jgi:hypothetical protein
MTSALPEAIWIPGRSPSVYVGTPFEMVRSMAAEMGEDVTVRDAVELLLHALAENRRLIIGLPANVPVEDLTRLFVTALLDTGLAKTMAAA